MFKNTSWFSSSTRNQYLSIFIGRFYFKLQVSFSVFSSNLISRIALLNLTSSTFSLFVKNNLSVNIIAIAHGSVLGWISPAIGYLKSSDTHLTNGPLSSQEVSWTGEFESLNDFNIFISIPSRFSRQYWTTHNSPFCWICD